MLVRDRASVRRHDFIFWTDHRSLPYDLDFQARYIPYVLRFSTVDHVVYGLDWMKPPAPAEVLAWYAPPR